MNSNSPLPETTVTTRTKPRDGTKPRRVPPYHVILENDDFHSFEFVVRTLCKALGYAVERSTQLTMQAHHSGRAIVWTGFKEVAELKAEQVRSCHEIREADGRDLGPLGCSIEPAPGG